MREVPLRRLFILTNIVVMITINLTSVRGNRRGTRSNDKMQKPSTKDRILMEALKLFAEKGYEGVGVDQIAEAVGIKGPSLYHHFKSKEDILDSLITVVEGHYEANFGEASKIEKYPESIEEMVQESLGRVNFTLHDERVKLIRRLLVTEQFRNERLRELCTKHTLTGLEALYTKIFAHMMESGPLVQGDAKLMALAFTTPVSALIQMADREPWREAEAMERIEQFVREFARSIAR